MFKLHIISTRGESISSIVVEFDTREAADIAYSRVTAQNEIFKPLFNSLSVFATKLY